MPSDPARPQRTAATRTEGTAAVEDWIRLDLAADAFAVRNTLEEIVARLDGCVGRADLDAAQIVLAEVLNNIVEHAYANHAGQIELKFRRDTDSLVFEVRDHGGPILNGALPHADAPDLDHTARDLPEGGFGWFLIRSLTCELRYVRDGTENLLAFRIACSDANCTARAATLLPQSVPMKV